MSPTRAELAKPRRCFALPLAIMLGGTLAVTVRHDPPVIAVVGAAIAVATVTWLIECRGRRRRSGLGGAS
jgi:hypothetical protein